MHRYHFITLFVCVALGAASIASTTQAQGARADRAAVGEDGPKWALNAVWDQSVTTNSFSKNAQLSYDPHYIWWFSFLPRYQVSERWSVGALASFNYELTQSVDSEFNNAGFYGRQTAWSDLRLETTYSVPLKDDRWTMAARFDVRLPTSKFSRARSRVLGPGARLLVSRSFDVLQGMSLTGLLATSGWFARSNVATFDGYACRRAPSNPEDFSTALDGCAGNASAGIFNLVPVVSYSISPAKRLSFGVDFTTWWLRSSSLATGCVQTLGGSVCLDDESGKKHWSTFTDFLFSVSYQLTDYLSGTLSYDTWAGHPDSDGGRENAFYNENTRLILSFGLSTERLYTHIRNKRKNNRESETPLAKR